MIIDEKIINVNFNNKTSKQKSHRHLNNIFRNYKLSFRQVLHKFGKYLLRIGKYNISSKILNFAKDYKPKLTNYLIGLTNYYLAQNSEKNGNYTKAKEYYDKAISYYYLCLRYNSKNPSDFHILLEIANIYLELDDIYAFSKVYQKMILFKSNNESNKMCRFQGYKKD